MGKDSKKTNPTHGEMAAALWAGRLLAQNDDPTRRIASPAYRDREVRIYSDAILDDPAQLAHAVTLHRKFLKKHAAENAETEQTEHEFYRMMEDFLREDDALVERIREELRREREAGDDGASRPFRPGGRKGR